MERLKAVVRGIEFHVLLFLAGLILFVQPLLIASAGTMPDAVLRSLFLPWAAVIVLLFFASLSYRTRRMGDGGVGVADESSGDQTGDNEGRDRGE